MSAKAICEASGKDLINRNLPHGTAAAKCQFASVTENTDWTELTSSNPWLETQVFSRLIYIFDAYYKGFK
jgi:ATP citrate (pro-S)-lyase